MIAEKIDLHASLPLYRQVEQQILHCLAEGEWRPGDQLPTEQQLAERFGVAVFTLRAGLTELVKTGVLLRKQGKGTFVARHTRQRQRYQFSHVYDQHGTQVHSERNLVSVESGTASQKEAAALGINANASVLRIGLVLTIGELAFATMDIAVPAKLFRNLGARALREGRENIYAVYQDACNVNVTRIEERVGAVLAKAATARTLDIPAGSPVLCIERVSYTYGDVPVEFRTRYLDARKYHYRAPL